jgi:hypothetical protein
MLGGQALTSWTRAQHDRRSSDGSVLWKAPVPDAVSPTFTDVYLGRRALRRARTPNLGDYYIWADALCPNVRTSKCPIARYGFVYNNSDVQPAWAEEEPNAQFLVYHGWTASRHHLRAVIPSNKTVFFKNPSDRPIGYWPNTNSEVD